MAEGTKVVHSRKVGGCLPSFSDSQISFKTTGKKQPLPFFFFFNFFPFKWVVPVGERNATSIDPGACMFVIKKVL